MTPQEFKDLKLDARMTAIEAVIAMTLTALTRSPAARASLLETLDQLPKTTDLMRIRGTTPEYADLISGELHEAASGLVAFLKNHLQTH